LLVSSHFLASRYVVDVELTRALERHDRGEARVIPVLLRPVRKGSLGRMEKLQILPSLEDPVHGRTPVDEAWVRVAEGIERVVDELARVDGYPENIARDLRACWARLNPRDVDRHLRCRPIPPGDYAELRSPRGTTGYRWPFRRSAIYWSERAGAHPVWGAIERVYHKHGGSSGELGFPLSDPPRVNVRSAVSK
jgi:hypothetical protein